MNSCPGLCGHSTCTGLGDGDLKMPEAMHLDPESHEAGLLLALFSLFFETGTYSVAQARLEFFKAIPLPQPPE